MIGKECQKWRRGDCNESDCLKWDHCTLMNDNAKTPSYEDVKDAD